MSNPGFGSSQEEEESRKVSTFAVGVELTKKSRTAVQEEIRAAKQLIEQTRTQAEQARKRAEELQIQQQQAEEALQELQQVYANPDNFSSVSNKGGSFTKLAADWKRDCQFKTVARLVSERGGDIVSRFHPTELVLACRIKNEIVFFSAEYLSSSIPFSYWKEDMRDLYGNEFETDQHLKKITTMEWNVDGTQLAAISIFSSEIIVWSYPSGEILFQKELEKGMNRIEWNPFMSNVFATFHFGSHEVFLFNSCPVGQRPFHFCTIKFGKWITSFQWISENRVALGLSGMRSEYKGIEIWEIDESTTSAKIVKRLEHESVGIKDMAWDERTKCLATCSWNGWMTIWSMDSDQPIHALQMEDVCLSLAWRPNRKQTDDAGEDAARKSADNFILACGSDNGKIVIWTPLAEEKARILSQHSGVVDTLSFSPDGRFLASLDWNRKLIIWATENWQPVYIGEEFIWGGPFSKHFSWLSSSTNVPDYKLTFDSNDDKIRVVEYADDQ